MIEFDHDVCGNPENALRHEWLETNGLGGFASSTITGLNARRYHGLLIAALQPPTKRTMLLSKVEEELIIAGEGSDKPARQIALSTNQFPGVIHPAGYNNQVQFRLDPFPVFTYHIPLDDGTEHALKIEKSVFMPSGKNAVVIQYNVEGDPNLRRGLTLNIRPLLAFRDYHSLQRVDSNFSRDVGVKPGVVTIRPYSHFPELHFGHDAQAVDLEGYWYYRFQYPLDQERGQDYEEDLYSPFGLSFDLASRSSATVIASTEPDEVTRVPQLRRSELKRRLALERSASYDDPLACALTTAADQFVVARGDDKTVIAGYPWFTDWGRDTMIALPGLTLVTGKTDLARSILLTFARHLDRGMLPNRFPDAGESPEYNTVDATLWMFEATRSLLQYTGDYAFVKRHLYDALADVIDWHVKGTRYNIHVDGDGLLVADQPGVQLTWMDAKVGDWVVTPREGKAVEIQVLWHNALHVMCDLSRQFNDSTRMRHCGDLAAQAQRSFNTVFWNGEAKCLYDVIQPDGTPDASIRPNQIFAVSLPHNLLPPERARQVVEVVQRDLFTPRGLRSLSPHDPRFRGRYEGDMRSRDGAYHQGTVWAWLMGPFITAYVKVHDRSYESRTQATQWLNGFLPHLREAGLGQVSEVFDGYAPHPPGGCIAQAWSVAELLRALMEDV